MQERKSMTEEMDNLKSQMGYVLVNGQDYGLWGSITDDHGGCLLRDLTTEQYKALAANKEGRYNVVNNRSVFLSSYTVVTNRFRDLESIFSDDLGAGVLYTLHHDALTREDIEALRLEHITVYTPVVGRTTIGIETTAGEFFDEISRFRDGEPIYVKQANQILKHRGWENRIHWSSSYGGTKGGIVYDGLMTTRIPMHGMRGHKAILAAIEKARAYRILLALIDGGGDVPIHSATIPIVKRAPERSLTFHNDDLDMVRYGLTRRNSRYAHHRSSLKAWTGLDEIGMEGAAKWVSWFLAQNRHFRSHWLQSDDEADPTSALEGLVRIMGWRETLYRYGETVDVALQKIGLGDLLGGEHRKRKPISAISQAHTHTKHIAQLDGRNYEKGARFIDIVQTWVATTVAYGCLVAAEVGRDPNEYPDGLRAKWANLIREDYKEVIAPRVRKLPPAFFERR